MASLSTMDTPFNNVESSVSCGQGEGLCVLQSVSATEPSFAMGPTQIIKFPNHLKMGQGNIPKSQVFYELYSKPHPAQQLHW